MLNTQKDWVAAHRHYLMPWSPQNRHSEPVFQRGEGCYLIDKAEKRYLDFSSGWICTNLGHGNADIITAIKDQADRLLYAPPFYTVDVRAEFSEELCSYAPWPEGARVHFTTGGGDANDDAVRTARLLTGRPKILAAYRSFHGDTSGTAGLTGSNRRWGSEPFHVPGVCRFFAPMPYRSPFNTEDPVEETRLALDHLRRIILQENPASIAAIIIEPVLGGDGVVVYPPGYLEGLGTLARSFGILIIHDEVMVGFGRVGEVFATIRFKLDPDIITFAKGVTGAYVPLGGFLLRESLASRYDDTPFYAGHTYSGHPLAMAAGIGAFRAYERGNHFKSAYRIEEWMRAGLSELQRKLPLIGDVRGLGAFFGVELVRDQKSREPIVVWQGPTQGIMAEFSRALFNAGLCTYSKYNLCVLAPPLTVTEEEVVDGLKIFGDTLREFAPRMLA